jgi:VWFA-related protein
MSTSPSLRLVLVTTLAGGVCSGIGHAQQKPAPQFTSEITVVTLPVFVTDDAGRAVGGLTEPDFEATDDGRAVRIVGFREVDASDPRALEVARDSPAARRQFLLLFDLAFSSVNGLVRSRRAAVEFVEKGLQPSDLAAVATFSANHGVRLLVGFTSDRSQLRRAIDTLGVLKAERQADPLGLVYDLTDLGGALSDTVMEEGRGALADAIRTVQIRFERSQEAAYRQRVLALMDGMETLAKALDVVQGRKQVVFLSNGFDEAALVGAQGTQSLQESDSITRGRLWEVATETRFGDTEVRQSLARMLQRFSSSDSVIHSVDLSGLAARGDARSGSAEPTRRTGRESLAEIANLSGGRWFKDTNDLGVAFGEVLELSRRYYLLAFEPNDLRGPGRFHKLRVKIKGKGFRVSHRTGYYEKAAYAERTPLERRFEAAQVIATGVGANELSLRSLAVPYRRTPQGVVLPVVLEADGASLLAGQKGDTLGLEIYGYALDPTGKLIDFAAATSTLSLARVGDKLRQRGLQVHAAFTLPPGRYDLRFLIRDAATGRQGSEWLDVNVPVLDPAEVMLFPPLFMEPTGDWVILQAASRGTTMVETPFRVEADPFAPRARPRLVNGQPQRVCLLAYDAGRQYDPGAAFEIKPQLLDAAGAPVASGGFKLTKAVAGEDGFRRFVLDFTPTALPAGDYRLRVRFRDPTSGRVSESYQAVSVQ